MCGWEDSRPEFFRCSLSTWEQNRLSESCSSFQELLRSPAYPQTFLCVLCSVAKTVAKTLHPSWTVAHQAPLSMGFSRQEVLGWVAISSSRGSSQPTDLNLHLLHWQADSLPLSLQGSPVGVPKCQLNPGSSRELIKNTDFWSPALSH